jgi:RNA recognition motif-containing protein
MDVDQTEKLLGQSLDDIVAARRKEKKQQQQKQPAPTSSAGKAKKGAGKRTQRMAAAAPYSQAGVAAIGAGGADDAARVYVGNLSFDTTWKELKDLMQTVGAVSRADVVCDEGTGRSKGYGIVVFKAAEGAEEAISTLHDTEFMGRSIVVRHDRGGDGHQQQKQRPTPSVTGPWCWVGNLSFDVTWQDLKDHMRQAGKVIRAEVETRKDGRSKGWGLVEFSSPGEARKAIQQLSGTELLGREITIRADSAPSSTSTGGASHDLQGGEVGKSVYVGNLAWSVSWQALKDHMRQAGNVIRADIMEESQGRSKGCAIVTFDSPASAARAIQELNDTELEGRLIFVREDRERGPAATESAGGTRSVFVSGLAWRASWQDVKDFFRTVGEVEFVEIPQDAQGRSKGWATVRFATAAEAAEAIRTLNGTELMDRPIQLRFDREA